MMFSALVIYKHEQLPQTTAHELFEKIFVPDISPIQKTLRDLPALLHDRKPCINVNDGLVVYTSLHSPLLYGVICPKETSQHKALMFIDRFHTALQVLIGDPSEDLLRENFLLLHELCSKMIDGGYLQQTDVQKLTRAVRVPSVTSTHRDGSSSLNEQFESLLTSILPTFPSTPQRMEASSSQKPVHGQKTEAATNQKPQLFVDIVEDLQVIWGVDGTLQHCTIKGSIDTKSYLKDTARVRIFIDPELHVGSERAFGSKVRVDDVLLSSAVDKSSFEADRVLCTDLHPGPSTLLQYQLTSPLPSPLPFRLIQRITHHQAENRLELALRLHCEVPTRTQVSKTQITIDLPSFVHSFNSHLRVATNTATFDKSRKPHRLIWSLPVLMPGSDSRAVFQLRLGSPSPDHPELALGPAVLSAELAGYLCSGLNIKEVKIAAAGSSLTNSVQKWSRLATVTNQYVWRLC